MSHFDYQLRTRIVFGNQGIDRLGELAREYGGRRVLLVSDPGIVAAGHAEHGRSSLAKAGCEVFLFDGVCENPSTREVDRGLEFARTHAVDLIVGLGGGSSMDCAKGVNFLLTNGGRMADYWGIGKAKLPLLPMIAVPTTAGTGSEAQSFALISDEKTHVKMACGDKKAACRAAVLDPMLTVTCPRSVSAVTGIDAVSHALETYVTKPRSTVSQMFSREAWRLMRTALPRVLAEPSDTTARADMLLGAHLAGAAIEASMLGIAHSLANPLTARLGTVHGIAVGLMLPHVIRFNAHCPAGKLYCDLVEDRSSAVDAADELADTVDRFAALAGLPRRLRDCGAAFDALPQLAADAITQWTAQFNPRPVSEADLLAIYRQAW